AARAATPSSATAPWLAATACSASPTSRPRCSPTPSPRSRAEETASATRAAHAPRAPLQPGVRLGDLGVEALELDDELLGGALECGHGRPPSGPGQADLLGRLSDLPGAVLERRDASANVRELLLEVRAPRAA